MKWKTFYIVRQSFFTLLVIGSRTINGKAISSSLSTFSTSVVFNISIQRKVETGEKRQKDRIKLT